MSHKKMKIRSLLVLILAAVILLSGCQKVFETKRPEKAITAKIVTLKGPTGIGMARVMNEIISLSDYVDTKFEVIGATDTVVAGLLDKSITIAAVPTNLAAVLYNRTEGQIQILAVNTLGVLHILDKSGEIQSIADLKDKKIVTSGQGAIPQYVLEYLLSTNGITPGNDVEIEYKAEHSEVATLFLTGEADIVMLPEPFVSTVMSKDDSIVKAIDLTEQWQKDVPDIMLSMGALVAQSEFVDEYPEEIEDFLDAYEYSINWAVEQPYEAAEFVVEAGIIDNPEIAESAIPNCNLVYIDAQDAKDSLSSFFEFLFENNPASVGGKVPADSIYYTRR